jgi:uncharacterized membrane protein YfcA
VPGCCRHPAILKGEKIDTWVVILLPLIASAAFFVKAMTGFGPALIFVSLGAQLLSPHAVIPVSAMLDATAGVILSVIDPIHGGRRFWMAPAAAIVVGSFFGGLLLGSMSADLLRLVLGVTIVALAFWFALHRARLLSGVLQDSLPVRSSVPDVLISGAGGVLGGLTGISGPPLIWHFGRKFAKRPLRQILIPVFLFAALARVGTYAGTGMITTQVLHAYLLALPGLLLGTFLGNRVFLKVDERTFSRVIGLVLLGSGLRLILSL